MVRPWDLSNLEWDGSSTVSSLLRGEISQLLIGTGDPYAVAAAVIARIASAGIDATVAPDVYGTAAIRFNGVDYPNLTQMLTPTAENAFTVAFAPPGWILTNAEEVRISIFLEDRDVANHDLIGTVVLTEEHLRQAWNAAPDAPVWIQVSNQMWATLYVQLRVRAEP